MIPAQRIFRLELLVKYVKEGRDEKEKGEASVYAVVNTATLDIYVRHTNKSIIAEKKYLRRKHRAYQACGISLGLLELLRDFTKYGLKRFILVRIRAFKPEELEQGYKDLCLSLSSKRNIFF